MFSTIIWFSRVIFLMVNKVSVLPTLCAASLRILRGHLFIVFDVESLWDGVHSLLLSGPPWCLRQELHHSAFRKTLGVPQQLIIIFINCGEKAMSNICTRFKGFYNNSVAGWLSETTNIRLTLFIVFIFTQAGGGFCLIHWTHHDFLKGINAWFRLDYSQCITNMKPAGISTSEIVRLLIKKYIV